MLKIYILLFTIIWLAFQPIGNVNAALRTKVRICAIKGTVQTGSVAGDGLTCPLKQTMKQTECRVVNQATMVETGDDGWAQLEYFNGMTVKIEPNTKVILKRNEIFVQSGKGWFKVEPGYVDGKKVFVIYTPTAIAGIRGTEFIVNVKKDGSTNFKLIEGNVEISDVKKKSSMMLVAGMEVSIAKGSSTFNTALLDIKENNKWWTDWPTLIPIAQMPGNTGGTTSSNTTVNLLSPIADSHVYAYSYSGWSKANWGKYNIISAGWNPTGGEKRAYLKFDVSGIDKATFKKATLKLYHYHTAGSNSAELGVYTVRSPWNEGNGNYNPANVATPGEVCWINQPQSDQYPVAYFNPGTQTNDFVEVDITALVKSWLEGMANHGMAIKTGENYLKGPASVYGFYAREHEDIDKRPSLLINGKVSTEGQSNASNANLAIHSVAGDWEITCNDGNIYKYILNLVQYDNVFYGDMIRNNGNEKNSKVEGKISSDGSIEFTRSRGNWRQYYVGKIVNHSGGKVNQLKGTSGLQESRSFSWYANYLNNSSTNTSITGKWQADQNNGYNGTLNLQQDNSGRITGDAIWNGCLKGTIDGKVSGNAIEFTISYPNGDKGLYKGTLTQNGTKIINGTVKGNNGVTANWNASAIIQKPQGGLDDNIIISDSQMHSWGYAKKTFQFYGAKNESSNSVAVYRWWHNREKDWISLAEGEISDSQMNSWGYTKKTFQFYGAKNKTSNNEAVYRWWHSGDKHWISLAEGEISDSQMNSWGYTRKMFQFYGAKNKTSNSVTVFRWWLSGDKYWVSLAEGEHIVDLLNK